MAARRSGSSAAGVTDTPAAEAREALAMWTLALRYASAAVKPVAQGAAAGVKERLSSATSGESSLKERLDPGTTDKGGKIGDAADALLEKMGKPGKLAAKASLGSRTIGRLAPGTNEPSAPEDVGPADDPPIEDETAADDGVEAEAAEDESAADEEVEDAEEEGAPEPTAVSEPPPEDGEPAREVSEPIEGHPGADPLHTDFDHAYSDEVENYQHRDAYATTR